MKKTILIVEDDDDFQSLYKDILLSKLDLDILQAFNGQEALHILEGNKPDLIILDMLMPVMDGETFFKILRIEKKLDIPVVIASVNDRAGEALLKVPGHNIQAVFRKPFFCDLFLAKIKEILNAN